MLSFARHVNQGMRSGSIPWSTSSLEIRVSAPSVTLATKLRPPSRGARHFVRPRLAARMAAPPSFRVALVSAPAGSGKTTLLSEWYAAVRAAGAPAAWLSLDQLDNDPSRFVTHLLAAFHHGCPGSLSEMLRVASASRDAPVDEVVARLVQALESERAGVPAVLVLDDYHEIRDETVHGAVDLLIRYAPRSLSIVLGTRQDPPLSLERLRIRGELVEVRWSDLRFTLDEASHYFRDVCRLPLLEGQVRSLCHRSEGWITALQLAAMSVAGASDADRFVSSFDGAQSRVAAYLMEDVLHREPPHFRQFLLQTSILDGLTAPLCNAVTGRSDAQELLETFVRKNLFTFELDDRHRWFRYHNLFLEFLRGRIAAEPGQDVATLHERASEWFERCGDMGGAVQQALAGRRFDRAARLLESAGRDHFRQGNFKELRRSIETLPDELVRRSPTLSVLHAWALAYLGEFPGARARIADAETALAGDPGLRAAAPRPSIPLHAEVQVLRAILGTIENDEPGATAVGPEVTALFPAEERALRAFAAIAVGYGERAQGDLEVALRHFQEAADLSEPTHSSLINSLAWLNVGSVNRLLGRNREARRVLTASLAHARERLWDRTFGSAILRFALALVLADENRPDDAVQQLSEAIEILEASDCFGFIGMALVERSRNHAALGDAGAKDTDLARAREVAHVHGVRRVGFHADLLEARLATRAGRLDGAAERLASAGACLESRSGGAVLSERQEALTVEHVRLAIAEGKANEAIRVAALALRSASTAGRRRKMIELLVLQSLAWSKLCDAARAADKLDQALALVGEEEILRPFLDAGPGLVPPLRTLADAGRHRPSAERLLNALREPSRARRPPPPEAAEDRLHVRESQILDLIARGLRNREIGDRLFLSEETVKWYIKRLFAKLMVRSRTEAVAAARRMGLLA